MWWNRWPRNGNDTEVAPAVLAHLVQPFRSGAGRAAASVQLRALCTQMRGLDWKSVSGAG